MRTDLLEALTEARGKYRNWGKWGPDDFRGTLNYIDDGKRLEAAALIQEGRTFSLAQQFNDAGPQNGFRGRINPVHYMKETGVDASLGIQGFPHGFGGADDHIVMPLQGGTQWDGLGHIFDEGKAWNGRPSAVVDVHGDSACGIEKVADQFVGRGVLLDIGRSYGDENGELPDAFPITEEHLIGTIEKQGASAQVGRGDIVMVRTGQLARCRRQGSWGGYAAGSAPGLSFESLDWLHRTEIAAISSDTWGIEVFPAEFEAPVANPLHQIAIPNMGLYLGEMWDFEKLAQDCSRDGRYDVFLVAAVIPVTGAVGTPINPIAIK